MNISRMLIVSALAGMSAICYGQISNEQMNLAFKLYEGFRSCEYLSIPAMETRRAVIGSSSQLLTVDQALEALTKSEYALLETAESRLTEFSPKPACLFWAKQVIGLHSILNLAQKEGMGNMTQADINLDKESSQKIYNFIAQLAKD